MKRWIIAAAGWLCFAAGWAGIFLSGLPTTVFWILAALGALAIPPIWLKIAVMAAALAGSAWAWSLPTLGKGAAISSDEAARDRMAEAAEE